MAQLRVRTGAEGTTTREGAGGRPTGPSTATGGAFVAGATSDCSARGANGWNDPWPLRRETGGLRRIFVRGPPHVRKRLLGHVCGFNRGLLLRPRTGFGTPRSLQGRMLPSILAPLARWSGWQRLLKRCCASIRPGPSIVASHIHRYTINMSTCE